MSGDTIQHTHHVDVEALFRDHGMHCTAQRKTIWEFFAGNPQGYVIGEAAEALKPRGIGLATVYRTVELFLKLGLLNSTQDSPGKVRYAAMCPGHSHALICRACHAVVEFDDCDLSVLEKLLMAKTGFQIDSHHLEIYGTCPGCAMQQGTHQHETAR